MINISFLSGTRADYGKIKPYVEYLLQKADIRIHLFLTGMQVQSKYGNTYAEIETDFADRCHIVIDNELQESTTADETAHIIKSYSTHLKDDNIDFVFIHGDRSEAMAGALAAVLNNVPVCHIEAGDLSGSIDDSLRHAISKLAHRFFVADERAKSLLMQMGEEEGNIHIVGTSSLANLPTEKMDNIPPVSDNYGILVYHPTTTVSSDTIHGEISQIMQMLEKDTRSYIVVLPNNDLNHQVILDVYEPYQNNPKFQFFKSLPFSAFQHLLKGADVLIGNSSCGVKEAPVLGVNVIDIGIRQQNRYTHLDLPTFHHVDDLGEISKILSDLPQNQSAISHDHYREQFFKTLDGIFTDDFWKPALQKKFVFR